MPLVAKHVRKRGSRSCSASCSRRASNFHEERKPTIGIWFAATLTDPTACPVAGDDAEAVGWFDPLAPPPLAFPTDRELLERLGRLR